MKAKILIPVIVIVISAISLLSAQGFSITEMLKNKKLQDEAMNAIVSNKTMVQNFMNHLVGHPQAVNTVMKWVESHKGSTASSSGNSHSGSSDSGNTASTNSGSASSSSAGSSYSMMDNVLSRANSDSTFADSMYYSMVNKYPNAYSQIERRMNRNGSNNHEMIGH